jgi:hypothetical protein
MAGPNWDMLIRWTLAAAAFGIAALGFYWL